METQVGAGNKRGRWPTSSRRDGELARMEEQSPVKGGGCSCN